MIDILITIGSWAFVIIMLFGFILYLYQSIKRVLSNKGWEIDVNVHHYYETKKEDKSTEDPNSSTAKKD